MTNPTPHRATPEQFRLLQQTMGDLVDRLAAAEQQLAALADDATHTSQSTHFCFEAIIQRLEKLETNSSAGLTGSAGELLFKLSICIANFANNAKVGDDSTTAARDVLRLTAMWLDSQGVGAARAVARWLREEVEP